MSDEPTTPGLYTYSGGAQSLLFTLDCNHQWWVFTDNGESDRCDWGYVEQALGVWDLIPLSEAIHPPDAATSKSQPPRILGSDVAHPQYQELLSADTNARAYGWEIHGLYGDCPPDKLPPLPEVIESSVDNPFIGPDWRQQLT